MILRLLSHLSIFRGFFAVVLLSAVTMTAAAENDLRATATYYIDAYGLVDRNASPLVKRAYEIFDRIRDVAEDPLDLSPSLKVINSDGKPWAIALPDGYIILSNAALKICYDNVPIEVGDARLAFVLGHEIAHLTAKDFWHRKFFLSLSGQVNDLELEKILRQIAPVRFQKNWRDFYKRKELQADDTGFLYASLANFRTDLLLGEAESEDGFLSTWVKQTRSFNDDLHYNAATRTAILKNRFDAITAQYEYFMSGVRLAHFGRYEDALLFFEKFQRAFPAHEVLNNMGLVHLELARKHMPISIRYQYWLPTFLENAPKLVLRKRTLDNTLPDISKNHLNKAEQFLTKAASMQEKNLSSRINLTSTYLYLGQFHKARAQIEEARKIAPNSHIVHEMRAIVIYEQEKEIDMWSRSVGILKNSAQTNASPTSIFNLAKLHMDRARYKQANQYWEKLLHLPQNIPATIFEIACKNTGRNAKNCQQSIPENSSIPPIKTNVKLGDSIDASKVKQYLGSWKQREEKIGPLPVNLFRSDKRGVYLAVDYQISMVVVKNHQYKTTRQLLARCGPPMGKQQLGALELWSYGPNWSALVENNKVRELWINGTGEIQS